MACEKGCRMTDGWWHVVLVLASACGEHVHHIKIYGKQMDKQKHARTGFEFMIGGILDLI